MSISCTPWLPLQHVRRAFEYALVHITQGDYFGAFLGVDIANVAAALAIESGDAYVYPVICIKYLAAGHYPGDNGRRGSAQKSSS